MDKATQLLFKEIRDGGPNLNKLDQYLKEGANINAMEDDESVLTALIFYQFYGDLKTPLTFLLSKGANPNLTTCDGFNCLFDAMSTNEPTLVKLLLEYGANPNCICTETGESLLDYAMSGTAIMRHTKQPATYQKNHLAIIDLLKAYGAKSCEELANEK